MEDSLEKDVKVISICINNFNLIGQLTVGFLITIFHIPLKL